MHKEGRAAAADNTAVAMVSLYGDQRCDISVKVLHSPPYAMCQGRGMLVLGPVETRGVLDFGVSVTIFLSFLDVKSLTGGHWFSYIGWPSSSKDLTVQPSFLP